MSYGEWVQFVVGAALGGFSGYQIGKANGATGWGMVGYIAGGALIGAASGGFGAAFAAGGGIAANTMGIAASSLIYTGGMNMMSGGAMDVSVNFGVGSYNMSKGTVNGLWNWDELKTTEKIGYTAGALANLQDLVAGVNGVTAEYRAEGGDVVHARLKGKYDNKNFDISVAHGSVPGNPYKYTGSSTFKSNLDYARYWGTHTQAGIYWGPSAKGSRLFLNNVNGKWLSKMASRLGDGASQGKGLFGIGNLRYGTTIFGCQSHVAHALWGVGVPTLPINFHPLVLYGQLWTRQAAIYSSPYLTNMK